MFLAGLLQLLQFKGPYFVVQKLSDEIQTQTKHQIDEEEDDSLAEIEHLENGIHPKAGHVSNDVNPHQVGYHEDGQSEKALLAGRILPEGNEQFQYNEHDDIRVHDVIQPAEIINVFSD